MRKTILSCETRAVSMVVRSWASRWGCPDVWLLAFVMLLGAPVAHAEWAEWIADLDIRYLDNDNMNNSAYSNDELDDKALIPSAKFGRYKQLGDATRLLLTIDLEAGKFDDFDKLDYFQIGGTAALRHKTGLGRAAPWVGGHVSAKSLNVDSRLRDSTIYEVGVEAGKQLTERLDGSIKLAYESRDGEEGEVVDPALGTDVFDQDSVTLTLEGNYLLTDRASVTAAYAYRDGDFNSSCTPGNVALALAAETSNIDAITFDDAFDPNFCVYRLDGTINSVSLDLNYAVGAKSSFSVGIERRNGEGDTLDYDSTIWRVGFVYFH